MSTEAIVVILYLLGCVGVGVWASRKVMHSKEEYWVAGRSIGTFVNAMAIMAALASGGSILGVMGYAYSHGVPATLALFAGAVVGFPIASVMVAKPLRNFGKFTITDFMNFRYPTRIVRYGVPVLILLAFTVYIVAQMKAAGIAANALLGIEYNTALVLSTLVFVLYVSVGGMLAVTWTDVVQGVLMVFVVLLTAGLILAEAGTPWSLLGEATTQVPSLGGVEAKDHALISNLGAFVIWAAAIPVIPHVVMRVYTAKDARGARMSLNLAMIAYSTIILAAVLVVVPYGKLAFPELGDADNIFLAVVEAQFPPLVRGLAVAAVLAAVMSTTDALLLACSSAVAHDLLGGYFGDRIDDKLLAKINVAVVWVVGITAMLFAMHPPELITTLYSAAIGVLSAGLFVPVIAGLWYRGATAAGGTASFVGGAGTYLIVQFFVTSAPPFSAILVALPVSAIALFVGSALSSPDPEERIARVAELHDAA